MPTPSDTLPVSGTGSDPCPRTPVLSANDWKIFAFGMLLSLVAMGMAAFSLGYTADDYSQMERLPVWKFHRDQISMGMISQGRWGYLILERILLDFGVVPQLAPVLGAFTLMACYSGFSVGLCRLWRIQGQMPLCLLLTGFVTIHPYQVELFTFRSSAMYCALSFIPGFAAILLARMRWQSFLWSVPCMLFSIASYQSVLNYLGTTVAMGLLIEWFRWMRAGSQVEKQDILALLRDRYLAAVLSAVAAIICYLPLNNVIIASSHIFAEYRSAFISIPDLPARVGEIGKMLGDIFILPQPVLPIGSKLLLLLVLAWGVLTIVKVSVAKIISPGPVLDKFLAVAGIPLVIGGILSVIGVLLALRTTWECPRAFGHSGVFWGGLLVVIWLGGGMLPRRIVTGLCTILLFSFCAISNHVIVDQQRVNTRDILMAGRMIERLEENPAFFGAETLVMTGGSANFRDKLQTDYQGINPTAFVAPWAQSAIIYEIYARHFRKPTPEELLKAKEYDASAPRWPEAGSVTVIDKMAIICLPR